jgi:hypothetical protein
MAVLNNTAEEDLGDQDALEAELERELAAAEEAEAEAAAGPGPTPQGKKKARACPPAAVVKMVLPSRRTRRLSGQAGCGTASHGCAVLSTAGQAGGHAHP